MSRDVYELALQTGIYVNDDDHRLTSDSRPKWMGQKEVVSVERIIWGASAWKGYNSTSHLHLTKLKNPHSKQIMKILTITSQREW